MLLSHIPLVRPSSSVKKYLIAGGALALAVLLGVWQYRLYFGAPSDAPPAEQTYTTRTIHQTVSPEDVGEAAKTVLKNVRHFTGSISQIISLKEEKLKILTIRTYVLDEDAFKDIDFSSSAGSVRELPMHAENVEVVVDSKTALKNVTFDTLQTGAFVLVKTTQVVSESVRLSAEMLELLQGVERPARN